MTELIDAFRRRFKYVRLSLTEVCNFKCQYCLPNGYEKNAQSFLSRDEIRNLAIGLKGLGIEKIRLTGGEPSLRNDLVDIVADLKEIGIKRVALTTNGYKLKTIANDLIAAGLDAINVSIDSLNKENFKKITGHDKFDDILETVISLKSKGLKSVKLNCVLLNNINHSEVYDFIDFIKTNDLSVRFIELMRTGDNRDFFAAHHLSAKLIESILLGMGFEKAQRGNLDGPAIEYHNANYLGRIGIIAPYSKDFCANCNRLRISANGNLKLCLFGDDGIALRHLLLDPNQLNELHDRVLSALMNKNAAHNLAQGFTGSTKHLAQIGG